MTESNKPEGKRSDVGYKRPPLEHRFKPGQKPPPRKKRPPKAQTRPELLMRILQEPQRVQVGPKVRWCTKAELLLLVAFQLAEKGSPSVLRALVDCLMTGEEPLAGNEPWFEVTPTGGPTARFTMSGKPVVL